MQKTNSTNTDWTSWNGLQGRVANAEGSTLAAACFLGSSPPALFWHRHPALYRRALLPAQLSGLLLPHLGQLFLQLRCGLGSCDGFCLELLHLCGFVRTTWAMKTRLLRANGRCYTCYAHSPSCDTPMRNPVYTTKIIFYITLGREPANVCIECDLHTAAREPANDQKSVS